MDTISSTTSINVPPNAIARIAFPPTDGALIVTGTFSRTISHPTIRHLAGMILLRLLNIEYRYRHTRTIWFDYLYTRSAGFRTGRVALGPIKYAAPYPRKKKNSFYY